MGSPYGKKIAKVAATNEPVTSLRPYKQMSDGSRNYSETDRLISERDGEFNASSKKDLMHKVAQFAKDLHDGAVVTEDASEREATAALREALADKSDTLLKSYAEAVGDETWVVMDREGFAGKVLSESPAEAHRDIRIRIRNKDVLAFFVTADANSTASIVRQYYVYPPEYYLTCQVLIEDKEIEQVDADLLDQKFRDGLEATMVRKDRLLRVLSNRAAVAQNGIFYFTSFTPTVYSSIRTQLLGWGTPPATAVIAYDLWDDIIAHSSWSGWFDPVTKHELVLTGQLGSILNVTIVTDGIRHETLRVLSPGEVFMYAAPKFVGNIKVRKYMHGEAINLYSQGRPMRGWFLEQIEAMIIANPRAVVKAQRT